MNGTILQFDNLTLGYDRHPAVHHLQYAIGVGDLVAVVGPNGAGKSTLLKGIIGNLAPLEGEIKLTGVEAAEIAYLPQQADIDRSFPICVFDMVAMGLWRKTGALRRLGREGDRKVAEALAIVGLSGFERRPIGTLSGGQMQRALFARLLLQDAQLILLDEPFTAIDSATVRDLMGLIRRWHGESPPWSAPTVMRTSISRPRRTPRPSPGPSCWLSTGWASRAGWTAYRRHPATRGRW